MHVEIFMDPQIKLCKLKYNEIFGNKSAYVLC